MDRVWGGLRIGYRLMHWLFLSLWIEPEMDDSVPYLVTLEVLSDVGADPYSLDTPQCRILWPVEVSL